MQTILKKWGNSTGIIIPSNALAKAGISLGDTVSLEVEEGEIILSKHNTPEYTLNELLKLSPREKIKLTDEDSDWLNMPPVGKENP